MVSGAWFNKDVLMLNETFQSSTQAHSPASLGGDRSGIAGEDDSIFNIELYNLNKVKNAKELVNDYQHEGKPWSPTRGV